MTIRLGEKILAGQEKIVLPRGGVADRLLMHSWREGNRGDGEKRRTITRRQPRDRRNAAR